MGSRAWPVVLTHGPIRLRPSKSRDEQDWARIRDSDPAWFRPWDSSRPPESNNPSLTFAQLARVSNRRARQGQMLPWALEYRRQGRRRYDFIGQVTVSGITGGSACWAQIGYWIDPTWAGRGIVPTAVAMATDYCFQIGVHRVEIAIRPENTNSLAVVRKLGFRYDGRRDRYMHVDGAWRDHELFVLTPEEVAGTVLDRFERSNRRVREV